MACGTPCVVIDVANSAWIVDDSGIVLLPKDPELLEEWVEILSRSKADCTAMEEATRNRVVDEFNCRVLIGCTEAELEGFL